MIKLNFAPHHRPRGAGGRLLSRRPTRAWSFRPESRPPAGTEGVLRAALDRANGLSRRYCCSWDDVLQAIGEALDSGSGERSGGVIRHPNAYGWRKPTITEVRARRLGRVLGVKVAIYGRLYGEYLVSWRDAVRWTSARRRAARERAGALARDIPTGVLVTAADSLAAGNCPRETARVAAWFAGSQVRSEVLARKVAARAPHLLPYVRRTVDAASRRAAETAAGAA